MIRIPIKPDEVDLAKSLTADFDKQKTYDKLTSGNNYIGFLGELVFYRWCKENAEELQDVLHVKVVKPETDKADFIINGLTVDVKTTFDTKMWFQKVEHDVYVVCRVNDDLKELFIVGFATQLKLTRYIKNGTAEVYKRGERSDYVLPINRLSSPFRLIKYLQGGKRRVYLSRNRLKKLNEEKNGKE